MVKEVERSEPSRRGGLLRGACLVVLAGILPACGPNTSKSPPTVLNFYPSATANVPLDTPMYIQFDRPLDPGTVVESISLTSTVGLVQSPVSATVGYNAELDQISVIPTGPLPASASLGNLTTITLTVFATLNSSNGVGFGGQAFTFTTTTNPSTNQPGFLGATTATSNATASVDVEFTPATDAGTVQYNVFVSTVSGGEDFLVPPDVSTSVTTAVVGSPPLVYIRVTPNIVSGTTYFLVVRAQDQATGNWEFNTAEVSAKAN